MNKQFFSVLLFFLLLSVQSIAGKVDKKILKQAEYYFSISEYSEALTLYKQLLEEDPENVDFRYHIGVAAVHIEGEEQFGLQQLQQIEDVKKYPLLNYYRGLGTFYSRSFDEAISFFELTKNQAGIDQYIAPSHLDLLINNCKNAKLFWKDSPIIKTRNLGEPINTEDGHEYVPVITPDETMMIYTYRGPNSIGGRMNEKMQSDPEGQYFEDMMISYRVNGIWQKPEAVKQLNTKGHDASVALSPDGHQLFIYKSDFNNPGDIYESHLDQNNWTKPKPLAGEINSEYWEGSITMTLDERTVYFSSERPGGLGGKDIYSAELLEDGTWGNVKNLGSNINTPYDDDAPYILPDNKTLYFSSLGHTSMGGFDVFYAELQEEGTFSEPVNPGNPLNSLYDDRFYILTADGQRGYFSTKKPGGKLNYDIYSATPGREEDPIVLAMIRGAVFVDSVKVDAEFKVTNLETGQLEGHFSSSPETKKYSMFMNPGNKYLIEVMAQGELKTYDTLDLNILEEYVRVDYNYHFQGKEYVTPLLRLQQKLRQVLVVKREKITKIDLDTVTVSEGVIQHVEHDIAVVTEEKEDSKKIRAAHLEGYVYKVQVAAFRQPENFTWLPKPEWGELEKLLNNNGVTLFSLGRFGEVDDAIELHQKVVEAGLVDSFVAAYDSKGQRYFLFELTHYLDLD